MSDTEKVKQIVAEVLKHSSQKGINEIARQVTEYYNDKYKLNAQPSGRVKAIVMVSEGNNAVPKEIYE